MQVGNRPDGRQTRPPLEEGPSERVEGRPLLSWRAALVIIAVGLVVLLGGGSLLVRQLTGTGIEPLGTVPSTVATVEPPPTPGPRATPVPTPLAATTRLVEQTPVAAGAPQESVITAPTTVSTAAGQVEEDVAAAYMRYWDLRAQALLTLDPSGLSEVAGGESLAALTVGIGNLKSQQKALKTEVEHDYSVLEVNGSDAKVRDRYRDFSVYVDPTSKRPLPGEVRPSSPDGAPLNTVVFQLHKEGTTWKVVNADRYAND